MKNDSEYKRLVRLLVLSWGLLLFFMFMLAWWVSAQLVQVKNSIYENSSIPAPILNSIPGLPGKDGESITGERGEKGDKGDRGIDGKNGTNSVSEQTIIENKETIVKEVPVKGDKGDTGEQGEAAPAPREIELSKDKKGNILWRYVGDDQWEAVEVIE